MKKIGMIVGFLLCLMIVSTAAVSAAAPMDEEKSYGTCTIEDGIRECTSDCEFEDDEPNQDPGSYLIYF